MDDTKRIISKSILTDTANAIRSKAGTSAPISPSEFAFQITNLPGGGGGGNDKGLIERTLTEYIDTNNEISYIGTSAFNGCTSLTTVSFPICISIGTSAFRGCTKLTTVSFPMCVSIGGWAFYECNKLTNISFPSCTAIGDNAFYNCRSLTTIIFPECTTIGSYAFASCSNLTTVSFPACTSIASRAFNNCSSLTSIYLMNSFVAKLSSSDAFSNTKLSKGGIYVPQSLYESYKVATNWSYFSSRFISV